MSNHEVAYSRESGSWGDLEHFGLLSQSCLRSHQLPNHNKSNKKSHDMVFPSPNYHFYVVADQSVLVLCIMDAPDLVTTKISYLCIK